jgi:hypothetical protein
MKPWSEVEASPEFQALPDFDKSRAQSQYFDEVVVPRLEDPKDLEPARTEFFNQFKRSYLPADSGQSQGSSALNAGLQALAKVGTGTVEGLGKFGESYVRNLNPIGLAAQTGIVPGLQSVVDTYASVPSAIAGGADTAQKAVEEAVPVNPLYQDTMPVQATGTAGQVAGQLATVLTGAAWTKAPRVLQALGLGQAAAMGIDSGYDEADRLGVTNPWQRDALALSYAAAEAGVEGMGGLGSKPFVQALTGQIRETLMPSIARGARTAFAEGLEEPITGTAQAVASNVFGNEDPARPGYALNGQPLPTVDPTSAEFWKQRGEETLYGTLAGGLFAGAQFAGSRPKVDEMKKLQQKAALTIEAMQNKPDITEDEAADLEDLKREEANLSTMIRTAEAPPTTNIAVEATKMAAQTAAKADLPATAKQLEILQGLLSEEEPPQAPLYATESGYVSLDADAAAVEQSIQASEAARAAMDAAGEAPAPTPATSLDPTTAPAPSREGTVVADLPADIADTRGFLKKLVDGGMSRDEAFKELQRQRQIFWDQNDLPEGSLVHAPNAPGAGLDGGQDDGIFEKQSDGSWILLDKKGDFTKVKHPRIEALAGGTVQRVGKSTAAPGSQSQSPELQPSPRRPAAERGEFLPAGAEEAPTVSAPPTPPKTEAPTKPSREVPIHVIKAGVRTTEIRKPTQKLLDDLVEQKKIYTLLRNCLNS